MIFHFTPEQRAKLEALEQEDTAELSEELDHQVNKRAEDGTLLQRHNNTPHHRLIDEHRRKRYAEFKKLLKDYEAQESERIYNLIQTGALEQAEEEFYTLATDRIIHAYIITRQREKRGELIRTIATGTDATGKEYYQSNKGWIVDQDGYTYVGPTENGKYYRTEFTDEVLSKETDLSEITWTPVISLYDLSTAEPKQDLEAWDYLPEIEDLQKRTRYKDIEYADGHIQREYYLVSSVMDGKEMDRHEYMIFDEAGVYTYLKNYGLRDYFVAYKNNPDTLGLLEQAVQRAIYESPFILTRYNSEFEPNNQGVGDPGTPENIAPVHTVKVNQNVIYPVDKVNSKIWNLSDDIVEYLSRGEQLSLDLFPADKSLNATATYSMDFDDMPGVTVSRKLNATDKQVQIAAYALLQTGTKKMTIQNLYEQMGYSGKAGKNDYTKIKQSVKKMMRTGVHLDNANESKAFGKNKRPVFEYDGPLFPGKMVTATINGKTTHGVIFLYDEPPLVAFAKARNQITTLPLDLLAIPVNRNEKNTQLADYLMVQISHMKNPKGKTKISNKMLFETIYEYLEITERKAKSRVKETIFKLLDYYKEKDFIKGYRKLKDGVVIFV